MSGNVKNSKPTVVLATLGSLGDLHPFIALGIALRVRGARVILAAAADYRRKSESAGLEFRAVRPAFDDLERTLAMSRAELTRRVLARSDFLLRRLIMPQVQANYEDMRELVAGADLLLTSSLAFGARLAAERLAIPWMAVVLQPLMFLSAFDPPEIPGVPWLGPLMRRCGPLPTRWLLRLAKLLIDAQLTQVRQLRRSIGLPATRQSPMFEGQFGVAGALGLYSPLIGTVQADFPAHTEIVGFASFDSADGAAPALPPALEQFLEAAERPLVFTLGSLVVNSPGSFYRDSLAAARRLDMRAVLLVGEGALAQECAAAAHADGAPATDVCICAYAPHSLLFPRAAAIVHQGGIGTLAQALRSGRPQLVVPFYADQLDNAARARRLGVARVLAPGRYTAASAAAELRLLLDTPGLELRASRVGGIVAREDGAARGAAVVWDRLTSWTR